MGALLISFLGRLRLTHFLVIAIIVLVGLTSILLGDIKVQKQEKLRQKDNYTNLRDLDSLKIAHLTFKTTQEIEDYVDSNRELSKMISEQKLKIRKLQKLVYQKQTYIDNVVRTTNISKIVSNIKNDIPSIVAWKDSTECLIVGGDVTYKDDTLSVNVTKRKFNNTILISQSWRRSTRNIWTRIFGRKIGTIKATSKCGDTETIIIDKTKK